MQVDLFALRGFIDAFSVLLRMADVERELAVEAAHERECIEWVFGLTGGELYDRPWEPWEPWIGSAEDLAWSLRVLKGTSSDASERQRFVYWYEGPPDYDRQDRSDGDVEYSYRTVVCDCMYGGPAEYLVDEGVLWTRVAAHMSSGESECPYGHDDAESVDAFDDNNGRCPMCEHTQDEGHGYIYIGDDMGEVVYRSEQNYCSDCYEEIATIGPCMCASCAGPYYQEVWADGVFFGLCRYDRPDHVEELMGRAIEAGATKVQLRWSMGEDESFPDDRALPVGSVACS